MNIFAGESDVKKHSQKTSERDGEPRQCYVYEIRIDGVVRYIGKGRNGRIYSHLIDAKRTASRSEVKIGNLSPHFRKMLVSAVRRGLNIAEVIVASNLTDGEAYTIEQDPKYFPKKWSNPVNPLYRVPRPLKEFLDRSLARPSDSPPIASVKPKVARSTSKTVVIYRRGGRAEP
jgi:hypothetical protein